MTATEFIWHGCYMVRRFPHDRQTDTIFRMKRLFDRFILGCVVAGVVLYRYTLGLWLGGHCRFTPSCSQYMLDAVAKHGPWRGAWRGVKRICRCHPWGGCGHDPA